MPKNKKETAILTESSLSCLAKEISENNIKFFMNLNIPTVHIAILKSENDKLGFPFQNLSQKLLLFWLDIRKNINDKEKVAGLERSLRASNETRLADILIERYRLNMDLVPAVFGES